MIPVQLFVASFLGWLQHEQHEIILYLREENRVLKAQLRLQRLRLTDNERRRLAALGERLGRRILAQVGKMSHRTRFYGGTGSSSPGNKRTRSGGPDGPVCSRRSVGSSCGWRAKIPAGATLASKAR